MACAVTHAGWPTRYVHTTSDKHLKMSPVYVRIRAYGKDMHTHIPMHIRMYVQHSHTQTRYQGQLIAPNCSWHGTWMLCVHCFLHLKDSPCNISVNGVAHCSMFELITQTLRTHPVQLLTRTSPCSRHSRLASWSTFWQTYVHGTPGSWPAWELPVSLWVQWHIWSPRVTQCALGCALPQPMGEETCRHGQE